MKGLGSLLVFFGIGSSILYFLNMQFILLVWVDLWGDAIGWIIRIVMIGLGVVLWGAAALADR